ncbi:MAG: hypothetical protein C3F02_00255 [Parcubacteria group bacterium]|nr:MAG: hypothetical protein C3F02_00255 [Parcubacteria group bacterium]
MFDKLKSKIFKLLRRSEKYTKTDMVYLAHGQFWLTAGEVVSATSTFLLAIAFANLLPKETYGTYKYILSIFGILTISTLTGMNIAVSQAVARGLEGTVMVALRKKMLYGTIGSVASLGVAGYYYFQHNTTLALAFLIIAAFVPFMDSYTVYVAYLEGKKLFKNSTIYLTSNRIIASIILFLGLLLTKNIFIIVCIYFCSWIILRLITFQRTIHKFPPNSQSDPSVVAFARHSSLINVTASLIASLDTILLFHYFGAAGVAVYAFAMAPVSQFKRLFNKIPTLAMPKFATRTIWEINQQFWKRFFLLTMIGVGLTAFYVFIAPVVFKTFFPKYMDSVWPSQIYALTIIFNLALAILSPLVNSRLNIIPKRMLYLWNLPAIVLVLSIIITIKPLGVIGVIISQVIGGLTSLILTFIFWEKIKKIEAKNKPLTESSPTPGA